MTDYGYTSWENDLYTAENLKKYKNLLAEFAGFCQEKNINLIVALTPNTYHKSFRESLIRLGLAYDKKGEFDKAIQTMKDGQGKQKKPETDPAWKPFSNTSDFV